MLLVLHTSREVWSRGIDMLGPPLDQASLSSRSEKEEACVLVDEENDECLESLK